MGRRNLTDGWKWELAQGKKKLLLVEGKKRQEKSLPKKGQKGFSNVLSTVDNTLKEQQYTETKEKTEPKQEIITSNPVPKRKEITTSNPIPESSEKSYSV